VAKLTPLRARGRLFAARSISGALLGIAGGAAVSHVLAAYPYPLSFGILFLAAFAVMMASYLFLMTLHEDERSNRVLMRSHWRGSLSSLLGSRADHNFRNYLVADALMIAAGMANAFFAIYGIEKFGLSDRYAGIFTVAMMASMILGSAMFGLIADRFGHRINMIISASGSVIACITALAAPRVEIYLLVFICSAATVALGTISRLPLIAELSPAAMRPTSVALANVVTSPFVLSGIAAGWIADTAGYETVFYAAAFVSMAALAWLVFRVREPRRAGTFPPESESAREAI
jgi:MFS family permease